MPVAREVASKLGAPLEILAVRKLGAPHNPEYGVGALAEDGTYVVDAEAAQLLGIPNSDLDVIVVDDGVATGVTDTAALRGVSQFYLDFSQVSDEEVLDALQPRADAAA